MDYIKRLRLCIKWFQELEGCYLFEQEKLQNALEFNESQCAEMGMFSPFALWASFGWLNICFLNAKCCMCL